MIGRSKNLNPYPAVGDEKKKEANSGEFDRGETDLLQAYEHVVDCLIGCEATIKDLERQLAAKDEELAARDEAIAGLEDKVVQTSLELALARAREDELVNELQHGLEERFDRVRSEGEGDKQSSRKKAKVGSVPGSRSEPEPGDEGPSLDDGAETGLDDSLTSRLAKLGKNILKNLSDERVEVQAPIRKIDAEKMKDTELPHLSPQLPRPRLPHRHRKGNERLQNSTKSIEGVVFPVSSLEILEKGCVASSSSGHNIVGGYITEKTIGSKSGSKLNEAWPQFG